MYLLTDEASVPTLAIASSGAGEDLGGGSIAETAAVAVAAVAAVVAANSIAHFIYYVFLPVKIQTLLKFRRLLKFSACSWLLDGFQQPSNFQQQSKFGLL